MNLRTQIAKLERGQMTGAPWLIQILREIDGTTRGLPRDNDRVADVSLTIRIEGRETFWSADGKRIAWSALNGMGLDHADAAIKSALF